jgi:hypothetical protein
MNNNEPRSSVFLPMHMRDLRRDVRGYVVPFFVAWIHEGKEVRPGNGRPDFRIVSSKAYEDCVKSGVCWLCGKPLGSYKSYTIGPMCVINRTTSEPPSHLACAMYAVKVCPFMLNPNRSRNEAGMPPLQDNVPGIALSRNPGVMAIWVATGKGHTYMNDGQDGILLRLKPDPFHVHWCREGRNATREEAVGSINSGLPFLEKIAREEGEGAYRELARLVKEALPLLPKGKGPSVELAPYE